MDGVYSASEAACCCTYIVCIYLMHNAYAICYVCMYVSCIVAAR